MVYLYGVIHGGHFKNIFGGIEGSMRILPTQELIEDLSRFPRGTKVGIESMKLQDWQEVETHLDSLPFEPPEERWDEYQGSPVSRPRYAYDASRYWDKLCEECSRRGLEVVFLEDKNLWLEYNKEVVNSAENNAKRRNLLVKEKGESWNDYDRKRVGFNLEREKEIIRMRKILEIDRDSQLLNAIKSANVPVAVVGKGHSDYWTANPREINSKFGLGFEGYSAEVPIRRAQPGEKLSAFEKNVMPDFYEAFVRTGLERAIKLLESGRFSDETPDFVGTWDINEPLRGYFELFLEKDEKDEKGNGIFNGVVRDCLGDANIEGKNTGEEASFIKRYVPDKCSHQAYKSDIVYRGIMREGNIMGYFVIDGCGSPFYAGQKPQKDLVDLAMS